MNSCYALSFLTFLLLITGFAQSLFGFYILKANHITFMVLTSIVYLFTETLVIFFFVGTGVSIKEYSQEHRLDSAYYRRSIGIKRRVYPPLLLNILFMIILFVVVGAVVNGLISPWVYKLFFVFCLFHFVHVKLIQHQCFRDNTNIILTMSGLKPV